MIYNKLEDEEFICMWCQKEFDFTQGTWPQCYIGSEELNLNADVNDRTREEFVCYDCIGKYETENNH